MSLLLGALIGYLLGAVPFGLLVGRVTRGIDLREYGSHRTGATNALRTLGLRAAALVFLLDVGKGVAAVLVVRLVFGDDPMVEWAAALAGFAAIVGHNWSAFIGFTGGRGVATSAGALGAMSPITILVLAPIVVGLIWRTRYVSLGSITGGLLAPVITALLWLIGLASVPAIAYATASGLLVTAAHADNIARLRAGTERKIGQKEMVSTDGHR
ncbi:MAG TPA: glycerol-3-phosphate 1-O-acyltransferase PlsY [Candidatus Limnocylindrales bacterium]|nr:glycerol-3-phosphate 1-O-acyltransferase PlsY [Candidatus Limnocylindrales bacterium]